MTQEQETEQNTTRLSESLDKANRYISEMCHGDRKWIMSIPARPDEDIDLVLANAVAIGRQLLADNAALTKYYEGEIEHLRDISDRMLALNEKLKTELEQVKGIIRIAPEPVVNISEGYAAKWELWWETAQALADEIEPGTKG